jgi:hypothetical protein
MSQQASTPLPQREAPGTMGDRDGACRDNAGPSVEVERRKRAGSPVTPGAKRTEYALERGTVLFDFVGDIGESGASQEASLRQVGLKREHLTLARCSEVCFISCSHVLKARVCRRDLIKMHGIRADGCTSCGRAQKAWSWVQHEQTCSCEIR